MSQIDPDKALRETMTRLAAIAKDPLASGDVRTIAAGVTLVILAMEEKIKRLEARLESPR